MYDSIVLLPLVKFLRKRQKD